MKKLVLFGAGKIGRSFIGQLFSRSGYEVVFIDVFAPVIEALNRYHAYKVVIKSNEGDDIIVVKNVRGLLASDTEAVIAELTTADICAVSVGQQGLEAIMPLIAAALQQRYIEKKSPLDIIIAENLRNAADFFQHKLAALLPPLFPLQAMTGLVETSIGKMVPIMPRKDMEKDILQVFAEPYNTLIVDKKAFKNPIPVIESLAPKDNMKAWVDRKLFIHNLGHAATAYCGYCKNPQWTYIWEVLTDETIKTQVRGAMMQSAVILMAMYPGEFTLQQLEEHIDDLISRFENRALGDTVYRVGCDLFRKLSKEDRLVGAICNARKLQLPYNKILEVLFCAFRFRATDEQGNMFPADKKFADIYANNIPKALIEVCGFDIVADTDIIRLSNLYTQDRETTT